MRIPVKCKINKMDKWFNPKFEKNYRKYTKKRLQPSFFDGFFRKFSVTTWIILINVVVFVFVFLLMGVLADGRIEEIFSWIAL